jgi:hypothetical protein
MIVIIVISATCVLLRIGYISIHSGFTQLGKDDYAVLAAVIIGIPTEVIIDRGVLPNGLGRDVWTIPFEHIQNFARWMYILKILYFVLIAVVKLALLFFYLRIFPKRLTRKLLWATIAFTTLYGISYTITAIFQCSPISYSWLQYADAGASSGKCIDINLLSWTNGIVSIVTDIWMLALPLYEVFRLQLSWRRKISVALMFCVGTL